MVRLKRARQSRFPGSPRFAPVVPEAVCWLAFAFATLAPPGAVAEAAASDEPPEATLTLGEDGRVGVFLVSGPYEPKGSGEGRPKGSASSARLSLGDRPEGMPAEAVARGFGCAATAPEPCARRTSVELTLAHGGFVDLRERLSPRGEALAYASFIVRNERALRGFLLLGVDDGVRVFVDGKPVFTRDEWRPPRDDDDAVPLDLSPGRHTITLELHQRDGAWQVRARLVDDALQRPTGVVLEVPGGRPTLETQKPAQVKLARTFDSTATSFAPTVTVAFPEGLLASERRTRTRIHVRLSRGTTPLYDLDAGLASPDAPTRVSLPPLPLSMGLDGTRLEVQVGGQKEEFSISASEGVTSALALAARVLVADRTRAVASDPRVARSLADARLDVELRDRRLRAFVADGDSDRSAQESEAKELTEIAEALEQGRARLAEKSGLSRRAMISRTDGLPTELGLYVPPSYRAQPADGAANAKSPRRHALVVVLHGLNGKPLQMVRWFFGKDDGGHDGAWEDRHPAALEPIDAFVLGPSGHGNAMYRELGEEDVMQAIEWVKERYPIDASRISITGPSMGGIGAAGIPLRRPWVFSAAAPLCGYHSTFVRRDVVGKHLEPWERFLGEDRSNADWAANGRGLPLYIVHGTQDLPEENSKVLIDKYESLHYPVKHEHPDLGHNVWQTTYEKPETTKWLVSRQTQLHPKWVLFRTARTRWSTSAWVHVPALAHSDAWGEVRAHAKSKTRIEASTTGVSALVLDRDPALFDPGASLEVALDGQTLVFRPGEAVELVRGPNGWTPGKPAAGSKAGTITGPFRDVFHEPLLFVYGASEPKLAAANERVARAFAAVRFGVTASYPIISDQELLASGAPLANDRSLFLVGSPASNKVVAALDAMAPFPVRIEGSRIRVGASTYEGSELGAAFVRPNPARPDRYVAVVLAPTPEGMLRALSLPDFLPDFVVYDATVGAARGQLVLGSGRLRTAGFFASDWSLPKGY